jgi:hypothetical protein
VTPAAQVGGNDDQYLAQLASATSGGGELRVLDLMFKDVTDAGLAHLEKLTALQWLALGGPKVTDAGLAHVEKLTALRYRPPAPEAVLIGNLPAPLRPEVGARRRVGAPCSGPGRRGSVGPAAARVKGLRSRCAGRLRRP